MFPALALSSRVDYPRSPVQSLNLAVPRAIVPSLACVRVLVGVIAICICRGAIDKLKDL